MKKTDYFRRIAKENREFNRRKVKTYLQMHLTIEEKHTGQTMYVLDAAGNELAKFRDMTYAYYPALHPDGEVAAVYSNTGIRTPAVGALPGFFYLCAGLGNEWP